MGKGIKSIISMKRNHHKGIRALEKTRNIASALYLVTDFIPEHDPIRIKIREMALDALAVMMSDRGIVRADFHLIGHNLSSRLTGVLSLLDIARVSGFVSEMNHKLISSEINKLIDYISSSQRTFGITEVLEVNLYGKEEGGVRLNHNKFKSDVPGIGSAVGVFKGHYIGQSRTMDITSKGQNLVVFQNRSGRKDIIISELKRKVSMSVHDLVSVIKGVSEKTIQRDLIAMVKDKTVIKTGEKRWSRYSLAEVSLPLPK